MLLTELELLPSEARTRKSRSPSSSHLNYLSLSYLSPPFQAPPRLYASSSFFRPSSEDDPWCPLYLLSLLILISQLISNLNKPASLLFLLLPLRLTSSKLNGSNFITSRCSLLPAVIDSNWIGASNHPRLPFSLEHPHARPLLLPSSSSSFSTVADDRERVSTVRLLVLSSASTPPPTAALFYVRRSSIHHLTV